MIYFIMFKYVKYDRHSNFNFIQVIKVTSHTLKHGSNHKDDIHNYEMEYTMEQSDITWCIMPLSVIKSNHPLSLSFSLSYL